MDVHILCRNIDVQQLGTDLRYAHGNTVELPSTHSHFCLLLFQYIIIPTRRATASSIQIFVMHLLVRPPADCFQSGLDVFCLFPLG